MVVAKTSELAADKVIQLAVQTNPDQLANGQRFLTIAFAIFGVFVIFYLVVICFLVVGVVAAIGNFIYRATAEPTIKRFYSLAHFLAALAFAQLIIEASNNTSIPVSAWMEKGAVFVEFVRNGIETTISVIPGDVGKRKTLTHRVCNNLPADSFVAFASPDKVIPNDEVVEAKSWDAPKPSWALTEYEYRLTKCVNSNGENIPHIVETITSVPRPTPELYPTFEAN